MYKLAEDRALVVTVDIITPPVDDGRTFGRIAAANALSDVYAMGARPIMALSVVGFPSQKLDATVLRHMLTGLHETVDSVILAVKKSIDGFDNLRPPRLGAVTQLGRNRV